MNKFLKIRWLHNDPQYPILLFSEIDNERFEVRKVEVYADGSLGFAAEEWRTGDTELGDVPVPPVSEIAGNPEFVVESTSPSEFESMWARGPKNRGQI